MAYGLRILNDNLELLIDSEYVNPTFVQKLEFNTTPTSTESGIYVDYLNQLHAGYLKNTHTTPVAVLNSGNYIVLWGIPDTGYIDVYYNFPTSVMDVNRTLTCEVYSGGSFTYTLPTAYIFAVDPGGLSTLSSSAPALRMYNSSEQLTFNSNYTQLVPYSFSSGFFPPSIGDTKNVPLTSPTNGIYLLPRAYYLYGVEDSANPGTSRQVLYDLMYKRFGSTMYMKSISSYWTSVNGNIGIVNDGFGVTRQVSIMVADGDLYQGANGGSVNTTAPTYTLGANYATVNETNNTTITVTLSTTNVTNGTLVYYNVTGINAADLTSGSLNGSFTVQNNTANKSFVVAADTVTEGTETFLLTLVGISQSISVSILDTSRTPYSWSAPSATSVNEGSSIYIDFNALYNDPVYPVTFGFAYPATPIPGQSGETIYAYPDINFTYAIPSGANYTRVTVSPRADLQLEGLEKWRMFAEVGGTRYYSADITINDTTTSSITAADNWIVGTDNTVTINVIGGLGSTVYLDSGPDEAILLKSGSASSWYVNSNNFTVSTIYQAVGLYSVPGSDLQSVIYLLRDGAAANPETLARKWITTSSPAATYSFTSQQNVTETQTGNSIATFTFTNVVNKTVTFAIVAPSSGNAATSGTDVTINITSMSINGSSFREVSYYPAADQITEGTEYFRITATVDGSVVATTSNISISDTSAYPAAGTLLSQSCAAYGVYPYTLTKVYADGNGGTYTESTYNSPTCGYTAPSYSWATSPLSVNEGVTSSLNFNYTNAPPNTPFTFNFQPPTTGTSASVPADGSLNTSFFTTASTTSSGSVSVSYSIAADSLTEGTESFRIQAIVDGSTTYNSGNITINDTSTTPAATYTLTAGASSVNEGSSVTFTAGGTNIPNGTYYWTITNSGDFGTTSGSFTITSNSGSFSVSPTADSTTEGAETFTATIRDASFTALATSASVTINDTSTTPVATTPIWRFHRTVGSITWTVPAGRTSIAVVVIGGGAGGRSQTAGGGGGGGGGVQYIDPVAVTPGQVLTLTVGAGGGSNTNGSASSITGTGISITAGGGTTGVNSTSSNGGNQGSGNFGGGLGGTGAASAGGGGGGVGGAAGEQANGYSATAGIGGDGGASYPLFDASYGGPFNVCGGGGGAAVNEAGQGGFASGGQGAGPTGTGTNNGGAAVDHGGGGGGAKSGGTGGSGFRGMIAWYG